MVNTDKELRLKGSLTILSVKLSSLINHNKNAIKHKYM